MSLLAAVLLASAASAAEGVAVPPEVRAMEQAREELLKETSPELHEAQRRLRRIGTSIQRITARWSRGELSRAEAREQLLPLIREREEIRSSPEFLADMELAQASLGSPKHRARIQAVLRTHAAAPAKPAAPAPPARSPTP